MTTKEQYINAGYIPYSVRNNIEDKDLAGLLDYLEREMGWDIGKDFGTFFTRYGNYVNKDFIIVLYDDGSVIVDYYNFDGPLFECWKDLFFATYKTLLPAIRNLYCK